MSVTAEAPPEAPGRKPASAARRKTARTAEATPLPPEPSEEEMRAALQAKIDALEANMRGLQGLAVTNFKRKRDMCYSGFNRFMTAAKLNWDNNGDVSGSRAHKESVPPAVDQPLPAIWDRQRPRPRPEWLNRQGLVIATAMVDELAYERLTTVRRAVAQHASGWLAERVRDKAFRDFGIAGLPVKAVAEINMTIRVEYAPGIAMPDRDSALEAVRGALRRYRPESVEHVRTRTEHVSFGMAEEFGPWQRNH